MKKIIIVSILLFLFTVSFTQAAGFHTGPIVPCGGDNQPACDLCHLWNLASNIINFISFNLAIPVATLMIVVAGVIYMTSGGVDDKIGLAKKVLTNTIIGLVIIFCSWLLVDTLVKTLASSSNFTGIHIMYSWSSFPNCTGSYLP